MPLYPILTDSYPRITHPTRDVTSRRTLPPPSLSVGAFKDNNWGLGN